jgi:hypothetical protein
MKMHPQLGMDLLADCHVPCDSGAEHAPRSIRHFTALVNEYPISFGTGYADPKINGCVEELPGPENRSSRRLRAILSIYQP